MKRFLIALQFLTILPLKIKPGIKEKDFGKSLRYFPVIGLLIGMVLSAALFLLGFLPNPVKGALILITAIIVTGGIHLDGFADTCDAFYGTRPKEKILEIMRDSRIGVMGTIGIVCLLLLKFALIVSIPQNILWRPLIMMVVFARWSQVLACFSSKYARKDGKARFFIEYVTKKELVFATIITFALSIFLMQFAGIIVFGLLICLSLFLIRYVKIRIDGMTGDTIGAISEIAEVGTLFLTLVYTKIACF